MGVETDMLVYDHLQEELKYWWTASAGVNPMYATVINQLGEAGAYANPTSIWGAR